MKITIRFDHLVLFAITGQSVRALLPSGGHGAQASVTRNGATTARALPRALSVRIGGATLEAVTKAPTVDSYRLPGLNAVITPTTGKWLGLHEQDVNCAVELRGGSLVADEPTFDNAEDAAYKDDWWDFGNGVTSQLTNHVNYTMDTPHSVELIDGNGAIWHSFMDGDLVTISNMDDAAEPKTTIVGGDIELSEFQNLYALVGDKSNLPPSPRTAYRGQPVWTAAHTPDKPICASAWIKIS